MPRPAGVERLRQVECSRGIMDQTQAMSRLLQAETAVAFESKAIEYSAVASKSFMKMDGILKLPSKYLGCSKTLWTN